MFPTTPATVFELRIGCRSGQLPSWPGPLIPTPHSTHLLSGKRHISHQYSVGWFFELYRTWDPPSYLCNGYRFISEGVKRPERAVYHPPPTAEVKEGGELYFYSPSGPSWPVLGWTLPLPVHSVGYSLAPGKPIINPTWGPVKCAVVLRKRYASVVCHVADL